jgi:purine-binding chemotaxis protein CheW
MTQQALVNQAGPSTPCGEAEVLDKYLCFLLGEKLYGVNILNVKEIIEYTEVTPIPMMPEFFRGAINLRKRIVPVIDLAFRLGMKRTENSRRTCIVITELSVNGRRVDIGILVDAVHQVSDIPVSAIEPAPSLAETINTDFIHGIANLNDVFTILLNLEAVFSAEELSALTEFYKAHRNGNQSSKENGNEISQ